MIRFHYGTVGSGKSLKLLAEYLNAKRKYPDRSVCLVKPAADTRNIGVYTRFGGVEIEPDCIIVWDHQMIELQHHNHLFLDEAQFYTVEFMERVIKHHKKDSTWDFFGLRNDSNKVQWPVIQLLMNHADELIEMPTTCDICKERKACFNKSPLNFSGDTQYSVGFDFIPVCGKCYG